MLERNKNRYLIIRQAHKSNDDEIIEACFDHKFINHLQGDYHHGGDICIDLIYYSIKDLANHKTLELISKNITLREEDQNYIIYESAIRINKDIFDWAVENLNRNAKDDNGRTVCQKLSESQGKANYYDYQIESLTNWHIKGTNNG